MAQDRESGAAGREYGLRMGAALAKLIGAKKLSANSNEVIIETHRAVIKACAPGNDSIGVTGTMFPRLQEIYGAFEDHVGDV